MQQEHEPFVYTAWYESYCRYLAPIPYDLTKQMQSQAAKRLIERDTAVTLVGELEGKFLGFICAEGGGVHGHKNPESGRYRPCSNPAIYYLYVESGPEASYRKQGFATQLIKAAGIDPKAPFCHAYLAPRWAPKAWPLARFDGSFVRHVSFERSGHAT